MTSIVIPCYNEAKRLPLEAFADYVRDHGDVRFCFVDDGSTDGTRAMLEGFAATQPHGRVMVTGYPDNRGKAEAVRVGVLAALGGEDTDADGSGQWSVDSDQQQYDSSLRGRSPKQPSTTFDLIPEPDFVGFWDADLATPLSEIGRFRAVFAENAGLCAVVGERRPGKDARIRRNAIRNVVGRAIRAIVHHYNRVSVPDPICGAKLFTAETARAIFADPFLARWMFDVELFLRMRHRLPDFGFARHVVSLPLAQWREVPGSKVRLSHGFRILADLVTLKRHEQTGCHV